MNYLRIFVLWMISAAALLYAEPTPGLRLKTYDTTSGTSFLNPISNLMAVTPSGQIVQTADITHPSGTFVPPSFPGITSPDSFSNLWEGWLDVTKNGPGNYTFGTQSDDGSVIFLDLNQDGDFGDPGELIVNNNFVQGSTTRTGTVYLSTVSVRVAIGFFEASGGETMTARFKKGAGLAFGALDPINGTSGHFVLDNPATPLSPTILTQSVGLTIFKVTSTTLAVTGFGNPVPQYQWYEGPSGNTNTPLLSATSAAFTTPALNVETSYWVRVFNAEGSVNSNTMTVTVKSNNVSLASLSVSLPTSSFSLVNGQRIYSTDVGNVVDSITISATAVESSSQVRIEGVDVGSGGTSNALPLRVGTNVFEIRVTAELGNTTTYSVLVNRRTAEGGLDFVPLLGASIADAVFAHDFETVTGNQITGLKGPSATKTSGITSQTQHNGVPGGLPFSPGFLRFPNGTSYEKIDSGVKLDSPTGELSFSIQYNGRGDNGSDGGFSITSNVRLLSSYRGSINSAGNVHAGPYFGIETHEGARKLVFRTATTVFRSTAPVPIMDAFWHQAGFTFAEGVLRFYFDGQPLGDPLSLAGIGMLLIPAQEFGWTIGEDPQLGDTSRGGVGDEYFDNGSYDEAALWLRTLGPAEMFLLHANGLAATPRFTTPELPGTNYNFLVKRFDFGLYEGQSLSLADPELDVDEYTGGVFEPVFRIQDGVLQARNYLNSGSYEIRYDMLNPATSMLNPASNRRIRSDQALRIETEILTIRNDHGASVSVANGMYLYGFQIQTGGVLFGSTFVPCNISGKKTYRLDSGPNDPGFRFYVNNVLRHIGTASATSETYIRFGDTSGAFDTGSDSDWSYFEVVQTANEANGMEENAVHWEGDTPAGPSDFRWVQDGNWGFPTSGHYGFNIPQRPDDVVFDLATSGNLVSVSSTSFGTSLPTPHGARIKGLRLNQQGLSLNCPKPFGTGASIGVHGSTVVQKNATITVAGRPGFFYTGSLHVSGATVFTAPVGRIDGRLSGVGQVSVSTLPVPVPAPVNEYPIPPYPFPDALAIYGVHSPGGTLAHLDAEYGPGVGLQTIAGNLRYESGSVFEWNLANYTVGTRGVDYDAVTVNGNLAGSKAVFRIVLPGSDTFSNAFWGQRRTWTNIFAANNLASVNLAEIFVRFEYANANGLLEGGSGPQGYGYFSRIGSSLVWTSNAEEDPSPPISSPKPPPIGREFVRNGDGESLVTGAWSGTGIEMMPSGLIPSAGLGNRYTTGGTIFKSGNFPGTSELTQRVDLAPAVGASGIGNFRFGFSALIQSRLTNGNAESGQIEVTFRSAVGDELGQFTLSDESVAVPDWQFVEEFGEIPVGTKWADIILRATASSGGTRRVGFDNVSFVVTTSPFFRKVDLDAAVHTPGAPYAITLDPGSYRIRPSALGRFTAWHPQLNGSGNTAGNDTTEENFTQGWRWSFGLKAGSVVRDVIPKKFVGTFYQDPALAYASALPNVELPRSESEFDLQDTTTIGLHIPSVGDVLPSPYGGGVSLIIERAGDQDEALAHTFGPVPYLSVDDSPFKTVGFGIGKFQLRGETLQSGIANGVSTVGTGSSFVRVTFEPSLGYLPTHAGIVIVSSGTSAPNGVTVEYFNADGLLVATQGPVRISGEDYFFGAVYRGGIKSFTVSAPGGVLSLKDLQFGIAGDDGGTSGNGPVFAINPGVMRAGQVDVAVNLPLGGMVVGGAFAIAGGEERAGLARFDSNGALMPWKPQAAALPAAVRALAVHNDRLFVGGTGAVSLAVVSLTDASSLRTLLLADEVVSLAVMGNSLFVASPDRVRKFDLSAIPLASITEVDWSGLPAWLGAPGEEIRTIQPFGSHLLIGGSFSTLGGVSRNGLARIDSNGEVDEIWTPDLGTIPFQVSQLLPGTGGFHVLGAAGEIRRLNDDGSSAWTPLTDPTVLSIATASEGIHLGCSDGSIRLYQGSGTPTATLSANGPVRFLHSGTSSLHVFGEFNILGGFEALGFAKVSPTNQVTAGAPIGIPGEILCMTRQPDGKLLIGGAFEWIRGRAVHQFARLLPASDRLDAAWRPIFKGGPVRAIAIAGDEIFIGGSFTSADGVSRSLAKYGLFDDAGPAAAWAPAVNDVTVIATSSDSVFVAGNYGSGVGLRRISRQGGAINTAWGPLISNSLDAVRIHTLQLQDGKLYLGGSFNSLSYPDSINTRIALARLDLVTGALDSWNPNLFRSQLPAPEVRALLFQGNLLYIAGNFERIQGADQPNLARMSVEGLLEGLPGGLVDTSWTPAVSNPLRAMMNIGENLFVAGESVLTVKTNVVPAISRLLATTDGPIHALSFDNGRILAGGAFKNFSGKRTPAFAATPFLGSPRVTFRDGRVFIYPDDGTGPYVEKFVIQEMTGGTLWYPNGLQVTGQITVDAGAVGLEWRANSPGVEPKITVAAIPPGGLNSPDLNPVTTVLTETSTIPVFRFDRKDAEVYEGDLLNAFVNFTGTEAQLGSVSYEIMPATARRFDGTAGDYVNVIQPLRFELNPQRQVFQAPLRIPVLEDGVVEGAEEFYIRLIQPSAGIALGPDNLLRVRIIDGARATGAPASVLDPLRFAEPAPLIPVATQSLTVALSPPEAGGKWRLWGDTFWRDSGAEVNPLQNQIRHCVDYRPSANYTRQYSSHFIGGGTSTIINSAYSLNTTTVASGTLQVKLSPPVVAAEAGRWRLVGETAWSNSGESLSLPPGNHLVEFQNDLPDWTPPAPRPVLIGPGNASVIGVSYVPSRNPVPANELAPVDATSAPYQHVGQIETDFGFATGTAVSEQTVLTAAKVLWNPDTLAFTSRAAWLHQKDARPAGYRPGPRNAAGVFILSGYAQQLATDNQNGTGTNSTGNLLSDNLDVGVAFFTGSKVARDGYSGFLADFSTVSGFNPWLLGPGSKRLVGYPLVGVAAPGAMHGADLTGALSHRQNLVFATSALRGLPGMEGAPLFSPHPVENRDYPTAIYLGENRGARFRALDGDVAELIYRSEFIAAILNFKNGGTGGGDEFQNTLTGDDFPVGFVQVNIPLGVGRWRIIGPEPNGAAVTDWYYGGEIAPVVAGDDWRVEFEYVAGLATPRSQGVIVKSGEISEEITGNYPLTAAVWAAGIFITPGEVTNAAISGLMADPDRDGIVNLLEFAFGLAPKSNGLVRFNPVTVVPGMPLTTFNATANPPVMTVEFLRRSPTFAPEITYIVEFSDSLGGVWLPATLTISPLSDITWQRVTASDPGGGTPGKRFSRVRVEFTPIPVLPP